MPETAVKTSVLEKFLRYVRMDTQSDESSTTYPSTAKQLDLLRLLVEELKAIGLKDAAMDEHGYVFATIPATTSYQNNGLTSGATYYYAVTAVNSSNLESPVSNQASGVPR